MMNITSLDLVEKKENKVLCETVLRMFDTVPQGMTTFQIQNFVLSNLEYPTIDSKWWQAKLELWIRMQNIISSHYEYRKKIAKVKEFNINIKELIYNNSLSDRSEKAAILVEKNEAIIEHIQIEIEENEFAIMCIKKKINDIINEMWAFWEIMQELEPKMKFSRDNKNEQEEEYWFKKALTTPELINRHGEVFLESEEVTTHYKEIYKERKP